MSYRGGGEWGGEGIDSDGIKFQGVKMGRYDNRD